MIYAVIDTNVIVSALITNNLNSPTFKVIEALLRGKITALYNDDIIVEYIDVLSRPKFKFSKNLVDCYINAILKNGMAAERIASSEVFQDADDVVFYEVALSKEEAYLVTGNIKHFPHTPKVVTPAEMIEIIERHH